MTGWPMSRWLVFAGGSGMILGAALPWLTTDFGRARVGVMGISIEAALMLAAGLALSAIALTARGKPGEPYSWAAIGVSGVAILVGLIGLGRLLFETAAGPVYLGAGLLVALAASLVACVGGCWPVPRRAPKARPSPAPAPQTAPPASATPPRKAPPSAPPAAAPPRGAEWSSPLHHDVVRFCQVMWPQPDPARWKYGPRRYEETVDYLARHGLLARSGNGHAWRFRQSQIMRWMGSARIE
jgi:hypothetical protein